MLERSVPLLSVSASHGNHPQPRRGRMDRGARLTSAGRSVPMPMAKNAGEILVPPGGIPEGFVLPYSGRVHLGYFAPQYTGSITGARDFASWAGVESIPLRDIDDPVAICKLAMSAWEKKRAS